MTDYFKVFALEPLLNLDLDSLEKKFHELSRQYHPDYHTTSPQQERAHALEMTALLNDAYRTLREPSRRAEYLLKSRGIKVDGSKVPQALLAEVFEVNEDLDQLRVARESGEATDALIGRLHEFKEQIGAMRREYDGRLREAFAEWDQLIGGNSKDSSQQRELLSRLADIVSHSAYIRNLERDIEKEVSD